MPPDGHASSLIDVDDLIADLKVTWGRRKNISPDKPVIDTRAEAKGQDTHKKSEKISSQLDNRKEEPKMKVSSPKKPNRLTDPLPEKHQEKKIESTVDHKKPAKDDSEMKQNKGKNLQDSSLSNKPNVNPKDLIHPAQPQLEPSNPTSSPSNLAQNPLFFQHLPTPDPQQPPFPSSPKPQKPHPPSHPSQSQPQTPKAQHPHQPQTTLPSSHIDQQSASRIVDQFKDVNDFFMSVIAFAAAKELPVSEIVSQKKGVHSVSIDFGKLRCKGSAPGTVNVGLKLVGPN